MLIDSHCHLDFDVFDSDRDQIIQSAQQAGVEQFILPSTTAKSLPKLARLTQKNKGCFYAAGLHPYFIEQHHEDDIDEVSKHLQSERCVAVGETGLDKTVADVGKQTRLLEAHLQLAQQTSKPVIVHCRKLDQELIVLLKKYPKVVGVIHGFSGSPQLAEQYIQLGFYIGVGGTITYQRANKTREAVTKIPLERILLETDSPDMPLYGFQGQRNVPERLPTILQHLAEIRPESKETLQAQIFQNTLKLFKLN